MKTSLAVLALTLSFATGAFAKDSVNLNIKANDTITLRKAENKRFLKISESVTGKVSLTLDSNGKKQNILSQELNESNARNDLSLEVTGKNILRVIDAKENINQEVQADIHTSIVGRVKSLSVDSKTMEALYAEGLKKEGLDTLKGLNIDEEKGSLTSRITTSDLTCNAEGDLLICNQTQELDLTISEK